jgi:hypothetical protein
MLRGRTAIQGNSADRLVRIMRFFLPVPLLAIWLLAFLWGSQPVAALYVQEAGATAQTYSIRTSYSSSGTFPSTENPIFASGNLSNGGTNVSTKPQKTPGSTSRRVGAPTPSQTATATATATPASTTTATALATPSPTPTATSVPTASPVPIIAAANQSRTTYTTNFPLTENPISEGGNWINGGTTGLDWTNVQTTTNKAFGTQPGNSPNPFNDSTAVVTGSWANDQSAQATVYVTSAPGSCCAEVELRLRTTITAHSITGYEFNCSVAPSNPYMEIVVWPGPLEPNLSDYPMVATRFDMGCVNGDVLTATAVGSTLTFSKNGVAVLSSTDGTYAGGAPGIGFYLQNQTGINANYGFSSFSAAGN